MDQHLDLGSSSPGPEVTMALVGSAGHLDQHEPSGSMALELTHDFRCGPRPQESAQPSMATGTSDMSIDLCCSRVRDPDMALAAA